MNCKEFRIVFFGNGTTEIDRNLTPAELDHLESCDNCSRLMELDQELDAAIREGLQQVDVPGQVKEKLLQNMAVNAASSKNVILKWAAAPVLALTAMFAIFFFSGGSGFDSMDDVGQLAIIDHESHLGRICSKGVPADLAAWGLENIGLAIIAPSLPFTNSELIAVSKCTLGDCEAAHLTYVHNGKRISVFIFPEKEAGFAMHKNRNYTIEFAAHKVTIWKSKHQVYALVT